MFKKKKKIFISYARQNSKTAEKLFKALKNNDLHPWIDKVALYGGDEWESKIDKAINECDHFLALFSKDFLAVSSFFQQEIRIALQVHAFREWPDNFFIPIRLDDWDLSETDFYCG